MAEILGLGVSHYPPLSGLDEDMANAHRGRPADPPSPSLKRCFDMGAATARILHDSPWRVAVLASSSWSHAFLCDKTYRLAPDVASDRLLYQAMQDGDFEYWRN